MMKIADVSNQVLALHSRIGSFVAREDFERAIGRLGSDPDRVADSWIRRYLDHFQDRPYLTQSRVRRVLDPLARRYLECLQERDMDRFAEELQKSARVFFELSTPFEEVLLCVHLFREACVRCLSDFDGAPLPAEMVLAFDELAQFGSSVMAMAYFRDVQRQWELKSAEARKENDAMRRQIEGLEKDLFSVSSQRFTELDQAVSRINRKLSDTGTGYREVYELARRLEHARDIATALGIFFKSALKGLHPECEVFCGLLDERKTKLRLYAPRKDRSAVRAELVSECRLSILLPDHRESLFEQPFKKVVRRDNREALESIFAASRLPQAGEYVFFPLAFHEESIGFVWMASAAGAHLTSERVKLAERLVKSLSATVFGLQNFLRNQKHAKLVAAIEKELSPDRTTQWEESLDRYLNVFLDLTGVERASLMILDPREKRLRTFAAKGYRVYPFSGRTFAMGEGLAGMSLKDLKTICVSRMKEDERSGMSVKSIACIPLWRHSTPIGVLNLSTLTYHKTFEASEIEMAQKIARRLSDTLSGFSLSGPAAAA